MLIINKLLPQGAGLAAVLLKRAGVLALPFAARQHHEANLSDGEGSELGLRLPAGTTLRGGDVLVAEDGSLLRVEAEQEPVLLVRPAPHGGQMADLLRLAHQLGEMHVHLVAHDDHLCVPGDGELAQWLERQGKCAPCLVQGARKKHVQLADAPMLGHLLHYAPQAVRSKYACGAGRPCAT